MLSFKSAFPLTSFILIKKLFGDLPDQRSNPVLQADSLPSEPPGCFQFGITFAIFLFESMFFMFVFESAVVVCAKNDLFPSRLGLGMVINMPNMFKRLFFTLQLFTF